MEIHEKRQFIIQTRREVEQLRAQLATKLPADKIPAFPILKGGSINIDADFAIAVVRAQELRKLWSDSAGLKDILMPAQTELQPPAPSIAAPPSRVSNTAITAPAFNPDLEILSIRGFKTHAELNAAQLASPDSDAAPTAAAEIPSTEAPNQDKDGIGKPCFAAGSPQFNPDAKLLKMRGVSSLDELNAKYRDGVRIA